MNSTYIYFLFSSISIIFFLYLFFYIKPSKNHLNNKILLKNLLESLDLDLPEELKRIENPSTDTKNFS